MSEVSFWARLVLAVLATWRVTHLLASEDGPADLVIRARGRLGHSLAGGLMDCFHCLSLWVAAPAALFVSRAPLVWLFSWLGVSGAACLVEGLCATPIEVGAISESSEGNFDHVLRPETGGVAAYPKSSGSAHGTARNSREARSNGAEQSGALRV